MRRKLTFADQHALKTLPLRMEKLSADITALKRTLAPTRALPPRPWRLPQQQPYPWRTPKPQLATAEEEWLRIELLREEMGQM